jgi:hypothetical protein
MSLSLPLLKLLHRKYMPSASIEKQLGRHELLMVTDKHGSVVKVQISQTGGGPGHWLLRKEVLDSQGEINYAWERQ